MSSKKLFAMAVICAAVFAQGLTRGAAGKDILGTD
jgi:hypothetical protein